MLSVIEALKYRDTDWHRTKGKLVKVDTSELILAGHSFGAATMVATANKLKEREQPRALALMDPWLFALHEDISANKVKMKCPVQAITTEGFPKEIPKGPYGYWTALCHILKNGKNPKQSENIMINKIGHKIGTDFSIVVGWELSAMEEIPPKAHF